MQEPGARGVSAPHLAADANDASRAPPSAGGGRDERTRRKIRAGGVLSSVAK